LKPCFPELRNTLLKGRCSSPPFDHQRPWRCFRPPNSFQVSAGARPRLELWVLLYGSLCMIWYDWR
jgi:hypothetical protein